jgi:hypothetical protein
MTNDPLESRPTADGELREQIKQLSVYKAATNFHEQYRPDKSNLTRFQANWIEGVLNLIKQNTPSKEGAARRNWLVKSDSSIPDDDSLEDIYYRCDVSNNRTDNPMSLEEFKAAIHQQRLRWEQEAYKRGVLDATGGYSYQKPMKSMRTRSTAFKLYAVKFFNGEIRKRRELLLSSLAADEGKKS